jgi:hypothetical protein
MTKGITEVISFASSIAQDITVSDIHLFSIAITNLRCLDTSSYKRFQDKESGFIYFLYRSSQFLEEFIEEGLCWLFKPEMHEELQGTSLIKLWNSIVMLLQ